MKQRIAVLAALAILVVMLIVWFYFSKKPNVPVAPSEKIAAENSAVASALAKQNPNTVALIQSNFANVQAIPQSSAISSAIAASIPSQLQFTNFAPTIVLENMSRAIRQFGEMFGGNPVGNNSEITDQMSGKNPKHINFIQAEAGMRINGADELVDPWGTPYFFHQISGTDMEIHSAGPDKIMWTTDDLVTH